ncbi:MULTISPECIES: hypothetical protein [Haloferacaceae]|uniref:Uncharacterized protein n=1 Tax=Halorubrum glutamatedens TaxID=2707018 RepID=A0ABD5QR93_9EURY|nr:hypothetical protein [Halobellus captivus]
MPKDTVRLSAAGTGPVTVSARSEPVSGGDDPAGDDVAHRATNGRTKFDHVPTTAPAVGHRLSATTAADV